MKQDKSRWNARYLGRNEAEPQPDPFLLEHSDLFHGGRALDLACGLGANSIFLAQRNYWVDSIDISESAISKLQARSRSLGLELGLVVADVDEFKLPEELYDLILVFFFFSDTLIPEISKALKKGGFLIYCTYNYKHTSLKPGFNPRYLVPEGGLSQFFPEMEKLVDEPEAGGDYNLSRFIARKR